MRRWLLPCLLTALLSGIGEASHLTPLQVYQPIVVPNGIYPCRVTYLKYMGASYAGAEILYTCEPNALLGEGLPVGGSDRNAASLIGLSIRVVYPPKGAPGASDGFFEDTLKVVLVIPSDVSEENLKAKTFFRSMDPIIDATLKCIELNGRVSRPRPRHLQIEILGPEEFLHYRRVLDLDEP